MVFGSGSLNPARSFGPAIVTGDFPSYHWIYCKTPPNIVIPDLRHSPTQSIIKSLKDYAYLSLLTPGLGPVLGASLAAGVYKFLLFAEYQTVNAGQDSDGLASCESLITASRNAGKAPDLEGADGLQHAGPA